IPGAAIHLSAGCHRVAQSDDLEWLLGLGTLPRLCQMLSSVEHLLAGYGGVRAGLQLDPGLRVKFRCFGTDAVEDQPRAFLDRASNGDDELEAETRLVACRSQLFPGEVEFLPISASFSGNIADLERQLPGCLGV